MRELEAFRRVVDPEHPDPVTAMGSLAGTLRGQGDLAGARTQGTVEHVRSLGFGSERWRRQRSAQPGASQMGRARVLKSGHRLARCCPVLDARYPSLSAACLLVSHDA